MFDDFQTSKQAEPRRPPCECAFCYTPACLRTARRRFPLAAASCETHYCLVCRCSNLYDVFSNIRDDELEHVKTMVACEDNSISVDIWVRFVWAFCICRLTMLVTPM